MCSNRHSEVRSRYWSPNRGESARMLCADVLQKWSRVDTVRTNTLLHLVMRYGGSFRPGDMLYLIRIIAGLPKWQRDIYVRVLMQFTTELR